MKYFDALKDTMTWLGKQKDTIFVGQTVGCPGTFMYPTLEGVTKEKRLEFPVCESFQMQFTLGLAMSGYIPISVYPRQNFLLLATADMVNMIDKVSAISEGKVIPHLIIRVASGPFKPIHPGHQHIGNYAEAFKKMFTTIKIFEIEEPGEALPIYKYAYNNPGSYLIIENGNYYGEK